jgi:hypothetical protein
LKSTLGSIGLSERDWDILDARLGVGSGLTLEETSRYIGGITRERVRQIQKGATLRLRRNLERFSPYFDALEQRSNSSPLWDPFCSYHSGKPVAELCRRALEGDGSDCPQSQEFERLIIMIRVMSDSVSQTMSSRWPTLTFLLCSLPPVISKIPSVKDALDRNSELKREARQQSTYLVLAETVLEDAGKPLHWKEISDRAEALRKRDTFAPTSLFNTLISDDSFTRVAQGTYALTKWGICAPRYQPDLIADVLRSSSHPMTYGEILQKVVLIQEMNPSSLRLYLDQHPRFYRSLDGRYGLRARLSSREHQTLRTPRSQVESPNSYRRVSRALDRGYDVQAIIEKDADYR